MLKNCILEVEKHLDLADLSAPQVDFQSWEDFDFRLRLVHERYTSAIEKVLHKVKELGFEDVVEAHDLLRIMIDKFEMHWNFLYILTKKKGSYWCMHVNKRLVNMLQTVIKTYMLTIQGHPSLAGTVADFNILQSLLGSEVWCILTKSKQEGYTFLNWPFSGAYCGVAGKIIDTSFVRVFNNEGRVDSYVPTEVMIEIWTLFVLWLERDKQNLGMPTDCIRFIHSLMLQDCVMPCKGDNAYASWDVRID